MAPWKAITDMQTLFITVFLQSKLISFVWELAIYQTKLHVFQRTHYQKSNYCCVFFSPNVDYQKSKSSFYVVFFFFLKTRNISGLSLWWFMKTVAVSSALCFPGFLSGQDIIRWVPQQVSKREKHTKGGAACLRSPHSWRVWSMRHADYWSHETLEVTKQNHFQLKTWASFFIIKQNFH